MSQSQILKCVSNVIAAPNPTPMTKSENTVLKTKKTQFVFVVCVGLRRIWDMALAIDTSRALAIDSFLGPWSCSKEHRPDEALQLLNDMKKSGVPPSNYTLSMLVKGPRRDQINSKSNRVDI